MPALSINGYTVRQDEVSSCNDTFKVSAGRPDRKEPFDFLGWVRKRAVKWEYRSAVGPGPHAWVLVGERHKAVAALFAVAKSSGKQGEGVTTSSVDALCPKCGKPVHLIESAGVQPVMVNTVLMPFVTEEGRRVRGRLYHDFTCEVANG